MSRSEIEKRFGIPPSEREFQDAVIELARTYQWLAAHFRPAWTEKGWRTAVQGDGTGFPDLALVRGTRLIFAELKAERGRMRPAQQRWIDALLEAAQTGGDMPMAPLTRHFEVYVWRPSDFDLIHSTLKRR